MSDVDLNPVRAGVALLPEDSDFTSIQQRIRTWGRINKKTKSKPQINHKDKPSVVPLLRLSTAPDSHPQALAFGLEDYLELVDWAGRAIREHKRGAIPAHVPAGLGADGPSAERAAALGAEVY